VREISAEKHEPFQLLRRSKVAVAFERSFAVAHRSHWNLGESWSMAERDELWIS